MANNRNVAIDALRFVFICILCPVHCPAVNPFPNGYIAVEFFFVLAGFFIYQSYRKHAGMGTLDFTLRKMRRFFWPLVLSIGALMLLDRKRYIIPQELTPDGIVSQYLMRIPELLFCQGLEIVRPDGYVNVTLWFISILLCGGAVIYSLLRNVGHKAVALVIPILVLLGITYLASFGNTGLIWRPQLAGSPLECNLVRGIVEMGIGVMLAYVMEQKSVQIDKHQKASDALGVIGLLGMVLIALSHNNYDTLSLFLVPMVIMACVSHQSLFSKVFKGKAWAWLGGLSMHIYFIHAFVSASYYIIASRVPALQDMPFVLLVVSYLLACLVAGYALKVVSDKLYGITFKG